MIPKFKIYDNHRKEFVPPEEVFAIGTDGKIYLIYPDGTCEPETNVGEFKVVFDVECPEGVVPMYFCSVCKQETVVRPNGQPSFCTNQKCGINGYVGG